jgi:superfamily I DNA/RNA helicase
MSPVLTPEQRRAVDSNAPRLVVQACAGAGKSSTLIRWAAARPQARVLLLTFNRSAAEQMRNRGPANMRASTTHALAFADVGKRYVHKLREPRTMDVARALHLPVELRGWLLAQDWDTEKLAALGSETSVLRAAA